MPAVRVGTGVGVGARRGTGPFADEGVCAGSTASATTVDCSGAKVSIFRVMATSSAVRGASTWTVLSSAPSGGTTMNRTPLFSPRPVFPSSGLPGVWAKVKSKWTLYLPTWRPDVTSDRTVARNVTASPGSIELRTSPPTVRGTATPAPAPFRVSTRSRVAVWGKACTSMRWSQTFLSVALTVSGSPGVISFRSTDHVVSRYWGAGRPGGPGTGIGRPEAPGAGATPYTNAPGSGFSHGAATHNATLPVMTARTKPAAPTRSGEAATDRQCHRRCFRPRVWDRAASHCESDRSPLSPSCWKPRLTLCSSASRSMAHLG
ncbi:MAG: hypothetical protein HY675_06210 [Chloroflexi bacterium]|nr:hypothetical protein [Chloroflexota bacterium]